VANAHHCPLALVANSLNKPWKRDGCPVVSGCHVHVMAHCHLRSKLRRRLRLLKLALLEHFLCHGQCLRLDMLFLLVARGLHEHLAEGRIVHLCLNTGAVEGFKQISGGVQTDQWRGSNRSVEGFKQISGGGAFPTYFEVC